MLRKPSCLTIWEALWPSHSHNYRLLLQGLNLLPPSQWVASGADGCLTPYLCHTHTVRQAFLTGLTLGFQSRVLDG